MKSGNKVWDMRIVDRNDLAKINADELYKELKKSIGAKIFSTFRCYKDDDQSYWLARKIYESIFEYSDDLQSSFLGIDLKNKLMRSHHNNLSDVIQNEYKKILEQDYEIEDLKRRLKFYETKYPIR